MNSYINAQSVPFIAEFDPEFEYEISIADYVPRRGGDNRFIRKPLAIGDKVPAVELSREAGVWQRLPSHLFGAQVITLHDLADYKPLVISFYSPEWGQYSKQHLELLDKSHQKIAGLGGQLLVLTSLPADQIPDLVRTQGLQFNLVHDTDNQIAEQLGVYSKIHPLWQLVAGVDADVSFPATFAVAQNGAVVYDFVSEDLESFFQVRDVLTAVYSVKDIRQIA
jgi:peroxiredoxin